MPTQKPVDQSFFDSARHRVTNTQEIAVAPSTVFASLAGAEDWKAWLGLSAVEYLSEPPHDQSTRRRVKNGPAWFNEQFFVWEPDRRLSFHFTSSPLPVRAFAEDYVIRPVADGASLTWTIAIDGPPIVAPLIATVMDRMAKQGLPKLARLLEGRAAS